LLEAAAELFDVLVVVKANRNVDVINKLLRRFGGVAVRRCYMENGEVSREVTWDDYFTAAYVWRGR